MRKYLIIKIVKSTKFVDRRAKHQNYFEFVFLIKLEAVINAMIQIFNFL